ncbi:MAG: hypothetical protein HS111_14025 [Kofleriaceae bacterium]|nr:hypothetical protein [Kofleriaceae bacterium]
MRLTSPPVTVTVALAAAGVSGAPARRGALTSPLLACAAWVPLCRRRAPAGARCADVATDHGRHTTTADQVMQPTWTPGGLAAPCRARPPRRRDALA